jgi:hypothetical protein
MIAPAMITDMISNMNLLAIVPFIALPAMALVVMLSAILFTVWLVVSIVQLAARLVVLVARGTGELFFGTEPASAGPRNNAPPRLPSVTFCPQDPFANAVPGTGRLCPRSGCRNLNVSEARYCARCGMPLVAAANSRIASI